MRLIIRSRMVLFSLVFFPAGIRVSSIPEIVQAIPKVTSEMAKLGEGVIPLNSGLYPWSWRISEKPSFDALKKNGDNDGILVAPILREIILNREPDKVLDWVDKICSSWDFNRIIPGHLENNIRANNKEFRNAFRFLGKRNKLENRDGVNSDRKESKSLVNFVENIINFVSNKNRRQADEDLGGFIEPLPEDLRLLKAASDLLTKYGIIAPVKISTNVS